MLSPGYLSNRYTCTNGCAGVTSNVVAASQNAAEKHRWSVPPVRGKPTKKKAKGKRGENAKRVGGQGVSDVPGRYTRE